MGEKHVMSPKEAESSFSLRIHNLSAEEQRRYKSFLLKYRLDQAKANNGRPIGQVPLEEKEKILSSALDVKLTPNEGTLTYGAETSSPLPTLTSTEKTGEEISSIPQKSTKRVWAPKWDPNFSTPGELDKN